MLYNRRKGGDTLPSKEKAKKQLNVRQMIERMSEGQQRKLLSRIEKKQNMCDVFGSDYDEELMNRVVHHLKACLGEY